jgi:DNA repair protein RadC
MPWPSLSEIERPAHGDDAPPGLRGSDSTSAKLAIVKWLFSLKDNRPFPEFRGSGGEAGWDMLLDLYIGELAGRKTSVTSACIGSRAPPTTALRYVNALCETRRVERHRDENDARRCWLRLAPDVREEIDRYLKDMIDDFLGLLEVPF